MKKGGALRVLTRHAQEQMGKVQRNLSTKQMRGERYND
jgi:hypothetical protein